MPKNVNTTANTVEKQPTEQQAKKPETLEQGIEAIRTVFGKARRMDIRIGTVDGADCLGNVIEGGVNGYMFALQRGVAIENVPEPILEVLRNAHIDFTELSPWKE
jgi:hypothetical protein